MINKALVLIKLLDTLIYAIEININSLSDFRRFLNSIREGLKQYTKSNKLKQ